MLRLIQESIRRMAELLTEKLAELQRHYRSESEQAARARVSADSVNSTVERAYVRNIARVRGRFLRDLAESAMQRI